MTKRERVFKAIRGEEVDRLPVSAWMHFPHDDTTHDGQVNIFLEFQEKYDWDIAKLMYRNTFHFEEWGNVYGDYEPTFGYWLRTKNAINTPEDWKNLKPLDVHQGAHGEMVSVTKIVSERMGEEVVKLATVFTPLMVAHQLAGDERLGTDLRQNKEVLHQALEVLTETVIDFGLACLEAGADGIFLATTEARHDFMSKKEYAEFGHYYNQRVITRFKERADLIMLHVCGQGIYLEEFYDYPVDILNWDDRNTAPSLAEAKKATDICLMGGVNMRTTLYTGSADEVISEAKDAIQSAGPTGFIVAPGCGIPFETPHENLLALRQSVER